MAKINLNTEIRFKNLLKQLGFKKSRDEFVRLFNDTVQSVGFGHATFGEKFVRYYTGSYGIRYQKVYDFANDIGINVYDVGGHMGYLMPQNGVVEWRLSDSDSEDYYLSLINEIAASVKDYVIPFFEKYASLEAFVNAIEDCAFEHIGYDPKAVVIAYHLLGRKKDALEYMKRRLRKLASDDRIGREPEYLEKHHAETVIYYPPINRGYIYFLEFTEKMKSYGYEIDL